MNIQQVAIILLAMGIATFLIGSLIVKRESRKLDFDNEVKFIRKLIHNSELSQTAYRNLLDAFRDFDTLGYRDPVVYKKLVSEFLFKYREFLPEAAPKIKIIPDGSDGYYNYKIEIQ